MRRNNEITIDLGKSLNPEVFKETSNILQNAAYSRLSGIIKEHLDKVKAACGKTKFHALRGHNSIFISGARGSGKTTFLLNIENAIQCEPDKKPYILDIIDPTLIHDNDNFLSIVLGRVADTVKKRESNCPNSKDGDLAKEFFNKLAEVAELSEAICNSKQSTGLDNILDEQNALNLEIGIHDLMKEAVVALDCPFLILPIDDIDMSFVHGFEIIEKIRKYLATPYIVPVISGDIEMYHQIFTVEFFRQMTHNEKIDDEKIRNIYAQRDRSLGNDDNVYDADENMYFMSKSYNLSDRYLEKVLPRNRRIRLMNVRDIKKENIKIKIGEDHPWDGKSISDVIKFIKKNFNLYCGYSAVNNNVFADENAPIPLNNLRELLQFLYQVKDAFAKDKVNFTLMNKRIMDFYEYGGNSTDRVLFDFARANCIAYGDESTIEDELKKSEDKFSLKRFAQGADIQEYFPLPNTRNKLVAYYPKPSSKGSSINKKKFKKPSNNLEKLFYIITFEADIPNGSSIFVSPDKFFLWITAKLFSPSDIQNDNNKYSFGFDNKIFQNDHIDYSELGINDDDEKRADDYERIKYDLTNKTLFIEELGSFEQADCSASFIYCLYAKFKENIDAILSEMKKKNVKYLFAEFAKKLIIVYVNAFAFSTTQSKRYSQNNLCISTADIAELQQKDMAFKWNISDWKYEDLGNEETDKIVECLQKFLNKNSGSEKKSDLPQPVSKEEYTNNLLLDFLNRLLEIFGLKGKKIQTFPEKILIFKLKNEYTTNLIAEALLKRRIRMDFTNYVTTLKKYINDDTKLIKEIRTSKEFKKLKDVMPFPKDWENDTRKLLGDPVYEATVGRLK